MNTETVQALLLILILLASAVAALRQLLPNAFRRVQSGIARAFIKSQRHLVVQRLGHWMQPLEAKSGGCGSGLGCGSCAGCDSSAPVSAAAIPLKFTSRPYPQD